MQLKAIQRVGGTAIILGAIFLASWAVFWATLLPVHERFRDFSLLVMNPNWVWIASLALPGTILMIFGFTAVYSRISSNAGVLGLLGYIFIILAYLLQSAKVTWEVFLFPGIINHAPSIPLLRNQILLDTPQVHFYKILANATIFLGVVLFCITLIKSREFPKISGILILCGAFIYALGPMLNIYFASLGVLILCAGCFVLGFKMFSDPAR